MLAAIARRSAGRAGRARGSAGAGGAGQGLVSVEVLLDLLGLALRRERDRPGAGELAGLDVLRLVGVDGQRVVLLIGRLGLDDDLLRGLRRRVVADPRRRRRERRRDLLGE